MRWRRNGGFVVALLMKDLLAARAAKAQAQSFEPESIGGVVDTLLVTPPADEPTFYDRLVRRVGLGDKPELRRKLFRLLDRLHHGQSDLVERCCSEVWCSAVGARYPGRYFCVGIKRRLAEAGIQLTAGEGQRYEPI